MEKNQNTNSQNHMHEKHEIESQWIQREEIYVIGYQLKWKIILHED